MDGLQSLKSARRNARLQNTGRQVMSVAISSVCLLLLSGCAFSRNLLNGPAPAAAPAASTCTHPDCAAPTAATATTMTSMPVVPGAATGAQAGTPMPQIPAAAQAASGMTAAAGTPMPVPPVPAAGAGMSTMSVVPQGWKLVPDVPPAVAPDGFTTAQRSQEQAECVEPLTGPPVVWPVDDKLLRCERQVAEMTEKIMGLQNVTEVTKQAMISMELEQIRLRNENEALKRRADESHREVIKSIDSLSEYMDEIAPDEAPPQKPLPRKSTPAARGRSTASPMEQTSLLPPVDEEL